MNAFNLSASSSYPHISYIHTEFMDKQIFIQAISQLEPAAIPHCSGYLFCLPQAS